MLLKIGVIGAVVVVGLYVLVRQSGGSAGDGGPPFQVGQPGPGAVAPPIALPSSAGGMFDLAAQRGKTVLLYFQEGLGCQPCWDQMRDIERNWSQYRGLGIDQMVSITSYPVDQIARKLADEGLRTTVLADPTFSLASTYRANEFGMMGTQMYGHSFILVGPDGKIRWRADYGGAPKYTMYVRSDDLLADLAQGRSGG